MPRTRSLSRLQDSEKMSGNQVFYTRTMAKILADQGNLVDAAKIYRYLLKEDPGSQDLTEALADVERKLAERDPRDLVPLFTEWARLSLKAKRAGVNR